MKGKILNARRDGKQTYITKQTKYGTFQGQVKLADEDKDVESDFEGYNFAEIKCDIQALKTKMKFFEQRALGIKHAYNVLLKSGVQEKDEVMRKLARQLKIAERDAKDLKEKYTKSQDNFKNYVELCLEVRRKIKNKKIITD